jgi:hypothetical protein
MEASPQVVLPRNSVTYIPLRFHIVTNSKNEGLPSFARVLDQLTRANADFAKSGIQFYLAGNNFHRIIQDEVIFENPSDNHPTVFSYKEPNVVNIFVCKSLGSDASVLGYFIAGFDYIAILTKDLSSTNNTLSHELGHYFSLRHTFYGWENDPYSAAKHGRQVLLSTAPSFGVAVEKVDKSNCTVAADQICDTPPDYGFATGDCTFRLDVLDSNGDAVIPMKENQMSYFSACREYVFTTDQINRMTNNLFSNARDQIRDSYVPSSMPITVVPTITAPTNKVDTYNNVLASWTSVAGATHYFVEVTDGRNNFSQIVATNSLRFTNLSPRSNYFIKIRAFSEGYTNTNTAVGVISTGSILSSVGEEDLVKFNVEATPNPVQSGRDLNYSITAPESGEGMASLIDIQGRMISHSSLKINAGDQQFSMPSTGLTPGIYFLKVDSNMGSKSIKISVID